ncbi:MAG: phytanoyl-CoA dioxygenase family protein [Planctomycetota bacterium]|nr:phytanoyl-CoA dioxygenase family protein [Planctomycetota bacterium]
MTYRVPESDLLEYYRSGYIVYRAILPASLVNDLRRECDKAVRIARKLKGPQAQRLQPVAKFADEIDQRPFKDYAELPALRDALTQTLSEKHYYGKADVMGVLLEPAEEPWCTAWHRDMTLASSRVSPAEYQDIMLDWNSANQINAPLYDDECTWFVPGSHLRARNLPGELAAASPSAHVDHGAGSAERDPVVKERICDAYTRGMPGAVQLRLSAGDFAMYRPLGWHIGNYLPYKKRATLHDAVFTPEYEVWWRQWISGGSPKWVRSVN